MIRGDCSNNSGSIAENIALEYLTVRGLARIRNNYRSRYGEIDLIMNDNDTIVFIEVRYRFSTSRMEPVETINPAKVRKIIQTSRKFIQEYSSRDKLYRFDIVTLTGNLDDPEIHWIKNAFTLPE